MRAFAPAIRLLPVLVLLAAPSAAAQAVDPASDVSADAAPAQSPEPAEEDGELASPARARRPGATLRLRVTRDVPITLAALAVSFASNVVADELGGPGARGDADDVFVLDRFVARGARLRPRAATASDVLLMTGVGGGLVASAFTALGAPGRDRRRQRFTRFALAFEALTLTNAATTLTKLAVRRPRPFTYGAAYDPSEGRLDDQLSYFSGHTSSTASALASLTTLAFLEPMPRSVRGTLLGVSLTWTGTVAALRVRAGKHFPTDVLTGAVVGSALGALVPLSHRAGVEFTPVVARGSAELRVGFVR